MYKSKLQELCQKKSWCLPEYVTVKQGKDHNPCFEATVVVNGISFQSDNPAKTSKEAQNAAAHVAFLHFTSPVVNPDSSNASANFDSKTDDKIELGRQDQNSQANEDAYDDKFEDMKHMYKNLLQVFAQKRNLTLPVYSCEFEGPFHPRRVKCKVTVNEQTFESLEFFRTIKEAEHAVAKIALLSLSPNAFQEEDFIFYKNLLQELTQKEGCPLPLYKTTRSGEGHSSSFVSIVEVKGETFMGQQAKTKKQAEILAAKTAYMKLKDCKSNKGSTIIVSASPEPDVPVLSSSNSLSKVNADTQQNAVLKAQTSVNPNSTSSVEDQQKHTARGTFCVLPSYISFPQPVMTTYSQPDMAMFPQPDMAAFPQPDMASFPQPDMAAFHQPEKTIDWQNCSISSNLYDSQPKDHLSTSNSTSTNSVFSISILTSTNLSATNSIVDSITKQPDDRSRLFQYRVIVHSRVANMKLPFASTILPISNDE